jgi:YVTN family beta-propeller protein
VVEGTVVSVTAQASGGLNPQYRWNFGDGSPDTDFSSSPAASHLFPTPGWFLVTVTVRDDTERQVTASYYQAVYAPPTTTRPTCSSSIIYESRTNANSRLWVVNPDNDSVTVFDAVTHQKLAEVNVGRAPRSLALAPDGQVWVANAESATVTIIRSDYAIDQTVSLARGARPFGIVFDPGGQNAFVALEAAGKILKLNPTTAATTATLDVGPNIRHLSLTADGAKLLATRFITPPLPGEDTASPQTTVAGVNYGGEVLAINPTTFTVMGTVILEHSEELDTPASARGIPNYLGAAVISPDGQSAWVPSKQDNLKRGLFRDGGLLTHDMSIRSIASRLNLATEAEDLAGRVDFDNGGIASASAFDPLGVYLFTALEGSREVAVVAAVGKQEILRFEAGRAPQGLVLSPDGATLFVHNFMDRSVSVHDLSTLVAGSVLPPPPAVLLNCVTIESLPADVLLGKQLFYDTRDNRVALQQYISCASCHNDGGQDGRVWDFTQFGEGLRNTITLRGHGGTNQGPLHWTGNFDEVQDFEGQIRTFAGGTGLLSDPDFHAGTRSHPLGDPKSGLSAELDALAAYVSSLTEHGNSPDRNADGTLTSAALAGQAVFHQQNCVQCHAGAEYTDSALNVLHDVGTLKSSSGQRLGAALPGLDTPTLRGLWATAPYLHDGSAPTLDAAISAHQGVSLTPAEMTNLVAFLRQLEDLSPAIVTLNHLAQTYDGTARMVTANTDPEGLEVTITYDGNAAAPTNAGSYQVIATVTDANYVGSTTNTLVVSPAPAMVTLNHLLQPYDGTARMVTADTEPDSLEVTITYEGNTAAPTNVGSYQVIATVTDANHAGSATNTLMVSPAPALVTLNRLAQTYDGTARMVTADTDPEGLEVAITYEGNANAPTNAGSYQVIATVTDANHAGSATNTLVLSPAPAMVTLDNLAQTYDGTARMVTADTDPEGLEVAITYEGNVNAPTNAGSYQVIATVADANYVGSATNSLVVSPAPALVTLNNLLQTYDGTARTVAVDTDPEGLEVTITYEGNATAPTNAGSYQVIATVTDANYVGSATNTLVVSPATALVTLNHLLQTYDGTARMVTTDTEPDSLEVAITYEGNVNAPTNAGNYQVIATVIDANYAGSATNTLVVSPAPALVTLNHLAQTYDGTARMVTANTDPDGLEVAITYEGNVNAPTNAGSHQVIATVTDANYVGSATNTLVVSPATATLTLNHLAQTYDGTARLVTADTDPEGLEVAITYDGNANAPTNAGSYQVIATVADINYVGSATNSLMVSPATATVTLNHLAQTYDGTARTVTADTDPEGLAVTITYEGNVNAPTNVGSYQVIATVADANHVGGATNTLVVSPAAAMVTLNNLAQTYDGTARTVTADTDPEGLEVAFTYDGNPNAPTNAGSYQVIATVTDANHVGSATNSLVVSPATAMVTLNHLAQTYDGTARMVAVDTDPEGLEVTITYEGNATAPTNAGSYQVIATVIDANHVGGATNTLMVSPATALVTLNHLLQSYDGTARMVTADTDPEGLEVAFTYDGNPNAPTNAGSYQVIATVTDANHAGSETNTLVVSPAPATVTLNHLLQTYDGTARMVTADTEPDSLEVTITYEGDTAAPTNAGGYQVIATVIDVNYIGSTTNTLVVSPAPATVTLNHLAQTYDGTARIVTADTDPEGLEVAITYEGNAAAPTNAGSYQVIATVADINYVGSATNSLVVSPAAATVTLNHLAQTYDGTARTVTADTDPDGLEVTITYEGNTAAPTNAGSYQVIATVADINYVGSATNSLVVSPAATTVTLNHLAQTYDGTARTVTADTDPDGLEVTITYEGNAHAPTNAGSYQVTATVIDANYVGSTTNTLVVSPAPAMVTLNHLVQTYDGTARVVAVDTDPEGLEVAITYEGNANAPTNAGNYQVIATVTDVNYVGSATNTLMVSPATAMVTLNHLLQTYDGTARMVTANTDPEGLEVAITYEGDANAPTNVGSYQVIATVADANYFGSSTNTLTVGKVGLIVRADDKAKIFGTPDPEFTASFAGFVNEENELVLSGSLSLTRAPGEAAGDYAILPSGLNSENYDITFEGGTLTISSVPPEIVWLTVDGAGNVTIAWSAVSNITYRVQYQQMLGGEWFDLVPDVVATNGIATKVDHPGMTPQRFYKVMIPMP